VFICYGIRSIRDLKHVFFIMNDVKQLHNVRSALQLRIIPEDLHGNDGTAKEAKSDCSKIMVGETQGPRGSRYTNYIKPGNKLLSAVELFNSTINYYYLE
jgi:hypothetical protein